VVSHTPVVVRNKWRVEGSNQLGVLEHGVILREIARTGMRLLFHIWLGSGPDMGWISLVSSSGFELLRRVHCSEACDAASIDDLVKALTLAAANPGVLSLGPPKRDTRTVQLVAKSSLVMP